MAVEFVTVEFVHSLIRHIGDARAEALHGFERIPEAGAAGEVGYWEAVLEANAAHVLGVLEHTRLAPDHVVRYRYYEMRGGDLRARPFVSRASTDVAAVKRVLDWHPAPDAGAVASGRDAELLYAHFSLERTPEGVFEYWFAMQEIWASSRWAHARVVATADELGQLSAHDGWTVEHTVEHCAPAVVDTGEGASHLAVLVYSPIGQHRVSLEQITVAADRTVRYGDPVIVATGPRGWIL
jgi:hypothetical protein